MATGYSLHIGLNRVDAARYQGWNGELKGCENDARDMQALAQRLGYKSTEIVLTSDATATGVSQRIKTLSAAVKSGDILLLTIACHGGQMADVDGDEANDRLDETWLLYDRQWIDDESYRMFGLFESGVRIVVVSDSCHSGSVVRTVLDRGVPYDQIAATFRAPRQGLRKLEGRFERVRFARPDVLDRNYQANQREYREIQLANVGAERASIRAGLILISGCKDNEIAFDGDQNGLFTQTLKTVWDNGAFKGGYGDLRAEIQKLVVAYQTPDLMTIGNVSADFIQQRPFSVDEFMQPPERSLITTDDNTLYLVENGQPRLVPDRFTFRALRLKREDIRSVPRARVRGLPVGRRISRVIEPCTSQTSAQTIG